MTKFLRSLRKLMKIMEIPDYESLMLFGTVTHAHTNL